MGKLAIKPTIEHTLAAGWILLNGEQMANDCAWLYGRGQMLRRCGHLTGCFSVLREYRPEVIAEALEEAGSRYRRGVLSFVRTELHAHGIHDGYVANEGRRQSKPAEVWVPCDCGGRMRPGYPHYCLPPEVPIDRSVR